MRLWTTLGLAGLLTATVIVVLSLCGSSVWAAADNTGELFPGVKGISGAELDRRIAEYEKQHKLESHESAPEPVKPVVIEPAKVAPPPVSVEQKDLPPADDTVKTPPADSAKTAPSAPLKTTPATTGSAVRATPGKPDFVAKLTSQTEQVERFMKKAQIIKDYCAGEAKKCGTEAWIQYYLRYYGEAINSGRIMVPTAVEYEKAMSFPITIYRYTCEMAETSTAYAKKARPAELSPEATKTADNLVERLNVVRRQSLVGAAELYTRIRHLAVAERIYLALLKEFPDDKGIQTSHEDFVKVRNEPKPAQAPKGKGA
jgi:hypothetical protein